ncbi:DUF924 family protein [Undibacterium arcticum]|uniref:DUF924 family protein n=1 Tax=Undibacterium arcticum TaxID=1762892 RepID=A0ABV7F314_9BURK
MIIPAWQAVLDFWFLPAGNLGHGSARPEWFRKNKVFDGEIRSRFHDMIEAALTAPEPDLTSNPLATLARILLLDQLSRNAYRDTPRAFAGDALAVVAAQALVASGAHLQLAPIQRWFVYMPFEHAEDRALQQQAVALFTALHGHTEQDDQFAGPLDYAIRHRDVVQRFGRFPHRNAVLGRVSTPEEDAFLRLPGSGF